LLSADAADVSAAVTRAGLVHMMNLRGEAVPVPQHVADEINRIVADPNYRTATRDTISHNTRTLASNALLVTYPALRRTQGGDNRHTFHISGYSNLTF
jgi:hypothetical protein